MIGSGKKYLHYDSDRVDYAVNEEELILLEEASSNLWKDICLVSGSLGIPALINAIHDTPIPLVVDWALFLNYLVGIIGILFAIIFAVIWRKSSGKAKKIITKIKSKPKYEIPPETINVGALPERLPL
jgi:hypothetical protein